MSQRKICFLSKIEKSNISEFISFSDIDYIKNISYKSFSITDIEKYSPDIIIIDDYFTENNYSIIIDSVISKFPNTTIFVLSPEYAKYNKIIKSFNTEKHFYSNLNEDVIQLISSTGGKDPSSQLRAC